MNMLHKLIIYYICLYIYSDISLLYNSKYELMAFCKIQPFIIFCFIQFALFDKLMLITLLQLHRYVSIVCITNSVHWTAVLVCKRLFSLQMYMCMVGIIHITVYKTVMFIQWITRESQLCKKFATKLKILKHVRIRWLFFFENLQCNIFPSWYISMNITKFLYSVVQCQRNGRKGWLQYKCIVIIFIWEELKVHLYISFVVFY